MKTRYPRSRIVATLFGLWAGWILKEMVTSFLEGPQSGPGCPFYQSFGGFCWADPNPWLSFQMGLLWQCAAFGGTLLMWYRPRAGYFCAGMGYLLYMTLSLIDYYASSWAFTDLGTCGWIVGMFALPVWLFWLCVNDEPQSAPRWFS